MKSFVASIRLVMATLLICVVGYTTLLLAFARLVAPETAEGSLLKDKDGKVIGSRLIAQKFTQPRYFWPRPSAAGKEGYDGMSAAGSNKSPTSSDLTDRARKVIEPYAASGGKPLPADLAAASGGGLDPHITERAALFQVERIAKARNVSPSAVEDLVRKQAFSPGGFLTEDRLVNVLELNLALDSIGHSMR